MKDIEEIVAEKIAAGEKLSASEAADFIVDVPARTDSNIFRGDDGFRRSQKFMELLDNPQDSVRSIHVAGTSGKGSVVKTLASLLAAHGQNVGSNFSPHVYSLYERWQHNGKHATGEEVAMAVAEIYPAILAMEKTEWGRPTYFEIVTAIAFILNKKWQVDYAVVETGMGGLLDTSNTINRADKLAIISELGLDHVHILGNTLAEIAFQKAGILTQNGNAIVLKPYDDSAAKVIAKTAGERGTKTNYISENNYRNVIVDQNGTSFDYYGDNEFKNLQLGLAGAHQAKNTSLALRALEFLARRDGFEINETAVREAIENVSLPARFERRKIDGQTIILDGAHNPQKLGALAETLAKMYPGQKFTWLMAFGKTKDAGSSFKIIASLVRKLIVSKFFSNQDLALSSKATPPSELAKLARNVGIENVEVEPDKDKALELALNHPSDLPIIIAGSFYFVGDLFGE